MFPKKTSVVKVRADSLAIHPYAQRAIIPATLKKRLAELDLDAIGVLHAVKYPINGEEKLWIIDGQHRVRALIDHGFGDWLVEVKVHDDIKDDAGACAMFLKLNNRATVAPFDTYENELKAGDSSAVGVKKICGRYGIEVSRGAGDARATCVSALKKLYKMDGGKTLDISLGTIVTAWGTKASALEGKLIEGMGLVFGRYNGTIDQAVLTKKLAKYAGGASGLVGDARGLMDFRRATLARCIAERVIETYNVGRRAGQLDPL